MSISILRSVTLVNLHFLSSLQCLQDVIHTISSPYGVVQRVAIFRKNGVQALVEFDSNASALRAKANLDGADIYAGCCTLKIEFARVSTDSATLHERPAWCGVSSVVVLCMQTQRVNVFKNDDMTCDYTMQGEWWALRECVRVEVCVVCNSLCSRLAQAQLQYASCTHCTTASRLPSTPCRSTRTAAHCVHTAQDMQTAPAEQSHAYSSTALMPVRAELTEYLPTLVCLPPHMQCCPTQIRDGCSRFKLVPTSLGRWGVQACLPPGLNCGACKAP